MSPLKFEVIFLQGQGHLPWISSTIEGVFHLIFSVQPSYAVYYPIQLMRSLIKSQTQQELFLGV